MIQMGTVNDAGLRVPFQVLPFNPTTPLNAFKTVYIAPRPAACEELKAHIVPRDQHYRGYKTSSHQKVKFVLV
jgi:hypothetical protein